MVNKELAFCGLCKFEFMLDFNNPAKYIGRKDGKQIWVCPECRKVLVGEG